MSDAEAAQLLGARATHGEAGAVGHLGDELAARAASEGGDAVEVHDAGAVDAQEPRRVEARLEAGEREVQHVARAVHVRDDVVAVGGEPRHAGDGDRHERAAAWSEATPEGRWRAYPYEELTQRDKASLDIFWLRDESLEDSANLPDPDVLAAEIAEDLQAALDQFAQIAEDLAATD